MEKWLANGVRLGWLIDPKNQVTYIYQPQKEVEQKAFDKTFSGENVLIGFELNIATIL